ncbi:MAG: hypothetical protein ACKOPT_04910, partial [Cyanobium sp.]
MSDNGTGQDLWTSDGTSSGTRLVRDILPGTNPFLIRAPTALDGKLYFAVAADGTTVFQVWTSDGSEPGTQPLSNLFPGAFSSGADHLEGFNNFLYYTGFGSNTGVELWRFDPKTGVSGLVSDINPNQRLGSNPRNLTAVGNN